MLLQTNSYIVPRDKRADHARLMRRFRQALSRLGCDTFEVYEQVGANWSTGETNGRFVQIMRFRDRRHQLAVQNAERTDTVAQTLIREFCDMVNFPYQQQQGLFAVGFYNSVLPVAPVRVRTEDEGGKERETKALPQRASLGALSGMVGTTEEQLTNLSPPQPPEPQFEEPREVFEDDDAVADPIMDADHEEGVLEPLNLDGTAHARGADEEKRAERDLEEVGEFEDEEELTEAAAPGHVETAHSDELNLDGPLDSTPPSADASESASRPVSFQAMAEEIASTIPREIDVAATPSSAQPLDELNLEGEPSTDDISQPIWDDSVFAQAIEGEDKSPHQSLLNLDDHSEPESRTDDSESPHESEAETHRTK